MSPGRPAYRYSFAYPGEPPLELSPDLLTALAALAWKGRSNYHALCDKYDLREDYSGMHKLKAAGLVRTLPHPPGKKRKPVRKGGKKREDYELTRKGFARLIAHNVYFIRGDLKQNEKSEGLAIELIPRPGTLGFFLESVPFSKFLPKVSKKMKAMNQAVGPDPTYGMLQEVVTYFVKVGKDGEGIGFDWDDRVLNHLSKMLLYWALLPPPSMAFSWLENSKLHSFIVNDPDFKKQMSTIFSFEANDLRSFAERLDILKSELALK